MKKVYLQVEFMTGKMFEYSKEEKEGFDKYVSTTGKESYRKYYKGVTGELESVSIRDTKIGQEIGLALKAEDTTYYMSISLMDQKGFVDSTYAEDLICKLPKLTKGNTYSVNPFRFIPEGDKYDKTGVSIKQGEFKIEKAFTNSYIGKDGVKVEGDIPAVVWKKDPTGKNKPSAASKEVRSDRFLEILTEQAERLKWTSNNTSSVNSSTPTPSVDENIQKKHETLVANSPTDDLDLPF